MAGSRFDGRVAVVTGSSRGIGRAIALQLAGEGARLVLTAFEEREGLEATAAACAAAGGEAVILDGDLADPEVPRQLVERAVERFGGVDLVVNNAFWEEHGSVLDTTIEGWDRTLDVCLRAAMLTVKFAIPFMLERGGGAIVNISSVHGLLSSPGFASYESAKAGLLGLTRSVAVEFGPRQIRSNAVCPGFVLTERTSLGWTGKPDEQALLLAAIPLRRPGTPEEIARTVAFLGSDDASFISGAVLCVDGGSSASLVETGTRLMLEAGHRPT
jgi:NAD(P)-dependent dehydrogenase (short-subunit alcohol dehydrogenase family)